MSIQVHAPSAAIVLCRATAAVERAGVSHYSNRPDICHLTLRIDDEGSREPLRLTIQAPDVATLRSIVRAAQTGLEQVEAAAQEVHA